MCVVTFKSNSLTDIFQIIQKRYWDHTRAASQADIGSIAMIIPTKTVLQDQGRNIDPTDPVGLEFVIDGVEKVEHENWHSNECEGNKVKYNTRYSVRAGTIRVLDKRTVEYVLDEIGQSATSINYL
jgi:hypothetical protein